MTTAGHVWHSTGTSSRRVSSLADTHHDGVEFGFKLLLLDLDGGGVGGIRLKELETLGAADSITLLSSLVK